MTELRDEHDEHAPSEELKSRAAMLTGEDRPPILEAMGGPLGMAESSLPGIAFVIAITAGAEIKTGAVIAVGFALLLAVARAVRKQTVQFAVSGVVGVGIAAYIAGRTGTAKNFFLPSLIKNLAYSVVFLISILIRRPIIGYAVQGFTTHQGDWRSDPEKMRRFNLATALWSALFLLRIVVMLPLYLTDSLVALGTAQVVLGLPLFAVGIWLTWLMLRVDMQRPADTGPPAADAEAAPAADGAPPADR